jgi:Fe-S-cluster-containing hydrogenase component 2
LYKVDQGSCTGCGVCVRICPAGAIGVSRGVAIIDQGRCTACGACAEACPRAAIYELIEERTPELEIEKETAIVEAPERAITTPPLTSLAVKAGKAMLPVAGAALSFIGKRVISQALRVLTQPRKDGGSGGDSGKGRGRQHRRRGRR